MTRKGRRLTLIGVALAVVGVAVGLALYAMSDSIALFLTPSEVAAKALEPGVRLRLGGLVETGRSRAAAVAMTSMSPTAPTRLRLGGPGRDRLGRARRRRDDLQCHRQRQERRRRLRRRLLRQRARPVPRRAGVVVEGTLAAGGRLSAEAILAKHDERYMPREVVEALKRQGRWQEGAAKP